MRLDNVGDVGETGSADDVKPAETDFRRDGKIFMRFSAVEQNQHAGICSDFLSAIANCQSTVIDKDCLTDVHTGFSCAGKIVLRITVIDADVRRVIECLLCECIRLVKKTDRIRQNARIYAHTVSAPKKYNFLILLIKKMQCSCFANSIS